ncbi:hypothetical protein [Amycolatopsis sp.]|uniref:hypothetical protein n=1 Tax=Amycolatopsis sp. TaxID=37632 RepID=UPI00263264AE|nr:hypothetical protein [Amycolatopsis sp.]
MPIRFQVDSDFYDHPKTTGMSDAAFSLWVRAGSYSAAKLTNGSVSEDVLALTLRSNTEVADELVRRGLWRRRKGGYVFHQWERRNLTKERVEADRQTDAARKRTERKKDVSPELRDLPEGVVDNPPDEPKKAGANRTSQVNTANVRPDSDWNPYGVQPESEGSPDVSVSVSVSSTGGDFSRGGYVGNASAKNPPSKCPQHINDPDPPSCGACRTARLAAEQWHRDQAAAAGRCGLCDGDGWRWDPAGKHRGVTSDRCNHQRPEQAATG